MSCIIPYLCGGIFFDLILQTRTHVKLGRNSYNGASGLSEADVMSMLLDIVDPDRPAVYATNTLNKDTSSYKTCKYNGGTNITLNNKAVIKAFDEEVHNQFAAVLARTQNMVSKVITVPNKQYWLVKALLDLLNQDELINENDRFYICPDGSSKRLCDIRLQTEFHLSAFLLGILHFVIVNRQNNKKGRATFEAWHIKDSGGKWVFNSDIGSAIDREIKLEVPSAQSNTDSTSGKNKPSSANSKTDIIPTNTAYFDKADNKIHFGQTTIDVLPELIPPPDIQSHETKYIQAFLDAVSSKEPNKPHYTFKDIENLKGRYKKYLINQRYNYFSAVRVCKIAKTSIFNADIEIQKWKQGTFDYISDVYYDEYPSGYDRLVKVMQKAVDTPQVCNIDSIQNLVKPNAKKGVCHLMVNDGKMKWIDDDDDE